MSQRVFDDREHRRGLVLGLTLAEVLLLLLFLLMLALGVQINRLQHDAEDAKVITEQLGAILDGPGTAEEKARSIAQRLTALPVLEAELAAAKGELLTLKPISVALKEANLRPTDLAKLVKAAEAARAYDPNDPVALLIKATDFYQTLQAQLEEKGLPRMEDPRGVASVVVQTIKDGGKGEHDWPPIINLSEANGFFFASGSAALSPDFLSSLNGSVATQLKDIVTKYDVDVVEVIGHTDEQPISGKTSNLDKLLFSAVKGTAQAATLVPADNAGLGMARAVSVAQVLMSNPALKGLRILPMSGAQLINVGDELAVGGTGDVRERRRIEIRVRRHTDFVPPITEQRPP